MVLDGAVPPQSIAVIGVGGIGSTFAYQLSRAGHNVTVIARPGSTRLGQLQRDRGIVHITGARADVHVADRLDEATAYDLVLVTTLAHKIEAVLPALQRSAAKWTHFMFNTFEPERLRDALGAERCSFGMPFVMAALNTEGRLDSKIRSSQKTLHGDRRWVEVFQRAGIPSAWEPDMLLWLRCHVPMCISFESISVAGQRRGGGASWRDAMVVARGMKAGFTVIKQLGFQLHPRPKSVLSKSPTFLVAAMLWAVSRITSFRELLATGVKECRVLIDVVVAASERAHLQAPVDAILAMKPAESPGVRVVAASI